MPKDLGDRVRKALPFPGTLHQDTFQRNDFSYGVAFFQHGFLDQAADSFQQVIAEKPDDPDAYYNLGTLCLRRNATQDARKYLDQALKLRPNYPEAWNNLGMLAAQAVASQLRHCPSKPWKRLSAARKCCAGDHFFEPSA
jgi:tetratricopeptide (TPR) repeat protein